MLLIGKWLKDNAFLLIILLLGAGGITIAVRNYIGQVEQLAVAKQNLELQKGQIESLKTEFGQFKDSTKATLDSLSTLRQEMQRIEQAAKKRSDQTNKRLEEIKNDPTMSDAQKEQEISLTYAQSLQSTYCLYVPSKCPTAKKDESAKPPPAESSDSEK